MRQRDERSDKGTLAAFIDPAEDRRLRHYGTRAWAWLGILLVAGLVFAIISALSGFVIPLVVATVLAMVLEPVVALLARVVPRMVAAVVVLVGVGVLVVGSIGVVLFGIVDQGPEIATQSQTAIERLRDQLSERGLSFGGAEHIADQIATVVGDALPGLLAWVPGVFSGVSAFLGGAFVAIFLLYFLMAEWEELSAWAGSHLGVPDALGKGIVDDATRSFRDYFYVLTISSLPVAILVGLAAYLMGIPLAFTIGLVTFVTSYIPYLGALVSSIFALLIAFGSGGPVAAMVILVVILVAQNVVQPLIQRKFERDTLDLHPIVSFGSTIVGSVVAGILGATLSAPFVAMFLRIRERVSEYHVEAGEPDHSTAGTSVRRGAGEADTAAHD